MTVAYISEFARIPLDANQEEVTGGGALKLPPLATQKVTFTTTTQSAALNGATRLVQVTVTGPACMVMGDNPTATTDDLYLAQDTPYVFGVKRGQLLAFIDA
jgi:hypothetical protein